jgi:hypothetical protein
MMKKLILATTILFMSGCGGLTSDVDGSNTDANNTEDSDTNSDLDQNSTTENIDMKIGTTYYVSPGNKIVKKTTDALIKIIHKDSEDDSTVVLLEGNASIVRDSLQ